MIRESGTDVLIVLTTLPSGEDVGPLARTLVDERWAACVTVLPGVCSVYRWEDDVESSEEQQVLLKTTRERLEGLRARLESLHPYDLPEFLVLPAGGSAPYLDWVRDATRASGSEQA